MGLFSALSPSISPTQEEVPPTFTNNGKEYFFIILITYVVVLLVQAFCKCCESLRRTGNPNPTSNVTTAAATRRNPSAMPHVAAGAPRTLQGITTNVHSSSSADGSEARPAEKGSCAICLEELAGEEKVQCLPQCGHMYHRSCINHWLTVGSEVYPICRRSVMHRIDER